MLRGSTTSIASIATRSSRLSLSKLKSISIQAPFAFRSSFRSFSATSPVNGTAGDAIEVASAVTPTDGLPYDAAFLIEGAGQIESSADMIGFSPTHLVMQCVEQVHLLAGIPYWEAIIVSTVGVRVLLVPSALVVVRDIAKMRSLKPEIKNIKDSFAGVTSADDPTLRFRYGAAINKLFSDNKIKPLKSAAISLFQLPIFITMFFGLRSMGLHFPDFTSGGDFWFTNLAEADPLYIFPALNALSFLAMIELGSEGPQTDQQKKLKWAIRSVALLIGPLTCQMPQGVQIYWITSNLFSLGQSLTLKNLAFRKYLNIPHPPVPDPVPTPLASEVENEKI